MGFRIESLKIEINHDFLNNNKNKNKKFNKNNKNKIKNNNLNVSKTENKISKYFKIKNSWQINI